MYLNCGFSRTLYFKYLFDKAFERTSRKRETLENILFVQNKQYPFNVGMYSDFGSQKVHDFHIFKALNSKYYSILYFKVQVGGMEVLIEELQSWYGGSNFDA